MYKTDHKTEKERMVSPRDYAFQAFLHIQEMAGKTNSLADPVVQRALQIIKSFPTRRDIIDKHLKLVEKQLKPRMMLKKMLPNPFEPEPEPAIIDGEIRLGKVKHAECAFGLNLEELAEHTLITGRAGAGKTSLIYLILIQLAKHGVPFWAFDFKQDYRHLSKAFGVLVFDWKSFRFNPLRPPPRVDPKLWMQAFTNVFCQVYWLLSGSKGIILEHVNRLYQDYGVFSGGDSYPCLLDLAESLKAHKLERKYGREAGFLESVQNRVNECALSFGSLLDCDKGFLVEELLTKNVVFELEGLLAENQAFLLNIILRYVFHYRISSGQRSMLRHMFCFDEAKTVYSKQREFSKELGIAEIAQFTSTIREFGEGLVVADQMPTQLADSIKANVYTVICMSQSGGPNVAEMSRTLGLAPEQAEALRTLQSDKINKVFEAVVRLNGRWPNPFIIQIVPFQYEKDVTDFDVEERMAPVLQEMSQSLVPRKEYRQILESIRKEEQQKEAELKKKRKEETEQKEAVEGNTLIQILTNIRDYPFIDQKSRIEMLGLASSSSTTGKIFKELVNRGLAKVHRIGLGRGKSTKTLYEITEKGREFARMDDFHIPGKGDFKHKFWQHTIKEYYEKQGYKAEIEKRYGNKHVDVGVEIDGKKIAVEVELSPDHLIENIEKDLEAGCIKVLIAVPSKKAIKQYESKISSMRCEMLRQVELIFLINFIS